MGDTLETNFISKFHSLQGVTLQQRYKNLYCLLNETQHLLESSGTKIDLSSLHPKTPLEEHFKIKALIHFKCSQHLFDVLQTENPLHIDQVLKHSWFLKEVFHNITPEYLTTEILPNLSYSTKQKLLNKLSGHLDDTHKSDEYFEAIRESYGLYLASKLFVSCSCDLIIKYIDLYSIELQASQLLIILKKWPDITESILEKLDHQNAKIRVGKKYLKVFKYLSKTNPDLFVKLYDKYFPSINLGTKETDTFIKCSLNTKAFKNGDICIILKEKQIAKSLGTYFEDFYYRTFPKCLYGLKYDLDTALRLLSGLPDDSAKIKMFSTTFEKVYSNEIWDYDVFKTPQLIEWMNPDDRAVFLEKYSKPTHIWEETWLSYYKTDKSLPLLKEKISMLSRIKGRVRYIIALLKTCKINKDYVALLDVLRYVNSKHRNDNVTLLQEFLCHLNSSFDAKVFTEEHWIEINLCLQYFSLNNNHLQYYCQALREKYISYQFSHNLTITDSLKAWIKDFPEQYVMCRKNPKIRKSCLKEFKSLLPAENKDAYIVYLHSVIMYNTDHPKDKLIFSLETEQYVEIAKRLDKTDRYGYNAEAIACDMILQDCHKSDEMGLVKTILAAQYYYNHHLKVINSLIKYNPDILLKYLSSVIPATSTKTGIKTFLRKYCTMYTHLDIPETIKTLCYDSIKDEDDDNCKFSTAVTALSIVSTPDEFLTFATPYHPNKSSIKIKDKQVLYKQRQAIIQALSNIIPLSQTHESILQFFKGDYLKFALASLTKVFIHTVEKKLPSIFSVLQDRAVSVRKHTLFLSKVLSMAQVYDTLQEFMQKEKNASILRIIFRTALYTFLQNPNDYSWKLSTQYADVVKFEDFEVLTKCRRVPLEYFGRYMQFTWNIIGKSTDCNKIREDGKDSLLELVTHTNILLLPDEFCISIIEQNLFKCDQLTNFQNAIHSFTCKYLIYSNAKEEQIQHIFNLVKDFQVKNSNNILVIALKCKLLNNFVRQLCEDVMHKQCRNRVIFEQFLSTMLQWLQPSEAYDEFIQLQLTSIYLKTVENKQGISEVGKTIASLCDSLYDKKCLDVKCFADCLQKFVYRFYTLDFIGESDENQVLLIESIINNRTRSTCLELVLYLMASESLSPIVQEKYDNIIKVVSKEQNSLLQIVLQSYLTNITD